METGDWDEAGDDIDKQAVASHLMSAENVNYIHILYKHFTSIDMKDQSEMVLEISYPRLTPGDIGDEMGSSYYSSPSPPPYRPGYVKVTMPVQVACYEHFNELLLTRSLV